MQELGTVTLAELKASVQVPKLKFEIHHSGEWVDICDLGGVNYLKDISLSLGGATMTPAPVAGTWSATIDNPDGIFFPANELAVYGDYFVTGRRVRISTGGTYGGETSGAVWVSRLAAGRARWRSVCYGNGMFVAVASSGTTNRVMTSTDGETWAVQDATASNTWYSVCYGGGRFVAVSNDGTNRVMTSTDCVTWTAPPHSPDANQWWSICYGEGLFVAVAQDGTNRVTTSTDGLKWVAESASEANTWSSVCYGNGIFVAVSRDGTNRVMTSTTGAVWIARAAAEANEWMSVCYGGGTFVAVAQGGTNRVMTSTDGINWTAVAAAEANSWHSVCYGDGLFVAVARDGTNRVMTSPDGATWTAQNAAEANTWLSVCYGDGKFIAVAYDGTSRVMTSISGDDSYWVRLKGVMDAPQFSVNPPEVQLKGMDFCQYLADYKLRSPDNYWGDSTTISTVGPTTTLGAEIYAEADALEIGAGEANNVTNWAGSVAAVSSVADAGGGSTYVMKILFGSGATTLTYSTAGAYEWTCPAGVTSVAVACWGAGGGGGGGVYTDGVAGGGGGGGAYATTASITVVPGTKYAVVVGEGGVGGDDGAGGDEGGVSYFKTTATIKAVGGSGGEDDTGGGDGGASASCVGDTTYSGGDGGEGYV